MGKLARKLGIKNGSGVRLPTFLGGKDKRGTEKELGYTTPAPPTGYAGLNKEQSVAASSLELPYSFENNYNMTLITDEVTRMSSLKEKRKREQAGQKDIGRSATLLTQKSSKSLLG